MYVCMCICRGDSGFCSLECREQAMNQDERKDKLKCSLQASKTKKKVQPPSSNLTNNNNNAETLAAAL